MRFFRESLGARLVATVFLLSTVIFGWVFLLDQRWQQANLTTELRSSAEFSTRLIELAIEEPMRVGNDAETQEQFVKLSRYSNIRILLTDYKGQITYATNPETRRRSVLDEYDIPLLREVFAGGIDSKRQDDTVVRLGDRPFFLSVKSVPNEPSCYHCHGSSRSWLGAVILLQDVGAQRERIQSYHTQRTLMVIGGLAAFLGSLFWCFRRTVVRRLGALSNLAEKVMRGDTNVSFAVDGKDELARLATTLSAMLAGRRRAEKELADLNQHLERLVAERTAALSNKADELEQANAQLQALDRMKSDFLSNVSHELKTPITAVYGFVSLVCKQLTRHILPALPPDDARLERNRQQLTGNLEMLRESTGRLRDIVHDVIDLTDFQTGKIDWKMEPLDPVALLRVVADEHSAGFGERGLELVVDAEPGLPLVLADAGRIRQVFQNLLSNARKFTTQGRVTVRARGENDVIRFEVEDTGAGIAPEDQERLFTLFGQLGDTLTGKPQGLGLGLVICRVIVARHGGTLSLQSTPGAGSCFSFTLPRAG